MRIHYFQHVPFEGPGSIEPWVRANAHHLTATRFYENDPLPDVDHLDWLIVLGGPMGTYEGIPLICCPGRSILHGVRGVAIKPLWLAST